ncbi:hypothetical protein ACC754_41100, partial [Rhizobium johnstonii]
MFVGAALASGQHAVMGRTGNDLHQADDAQEWTFSQGENRFAALYHYKTRDTALGTIAHYRPGAWGYQETVL